MFLGVWWVAIGGAGSADTQQWRRCFTPAEAGAAVDVAEPTLFIVREQVMTAAAVAEGRPEAPTTLAGPSESKVAGHGARPGEERPELR